jgi:56kDa selenium binding protein (SBP56)
MSAQSHEDHEHGGPGYASPTVARQQPPEQFVYVAALYEGSGIDRPDFIAAGRRCAAARDSPARRGLYD